MLLRHLFDYFPVFLLLLHYVHPGGKCDYAPHKNPALFGFVRMYRIFWHLAQCWRIFFDFFSIFFVK